MVRRHYSVTEFKSNRFVLVVGAKRVKFRSTSSRVSRGLLRMLHSSGGGLLVYMPSMLGSIRNLAGSTSSF